MTRLILAAFAIFAAGCNGDGPTVKLAGSVTYLGKAVTSGSVSVVNAKGIARSAEIQPDGSYTIPDAPSGELKIAVVSPDPRKDDPARSISRGPATPPAPAALAKAATWVALPAKYGNPDQSNLAVTPTGTEFKHNIPLE